MGRDFSRTSKTSNEFDPRVFSSREESVVYRQLNAFHGNVVAEAWFNAKIGARSDLTYFVRLRGGKGTIAPKLAREKLLQSVICEKVAFVTEDAANVNVYRLADFT